MIRLASRLRIAAIPLCAVLLCALTGSAAAATPSSPSVLVTTQTVRTGTLKRTVTAYGRVGPAPGASQTLTLAYAGIVTALDVVPGMRVTKGQIIAEISAAPATRAAYSQAQAKRASAQQTLDHTRALLRQHLATRTQLAQAEQAAQSAKAALDALKSEGAGQRRAALTAPYDGVVRAVAAAPGAQLQPGAAVATIDRGDRLVATVGVDPEEARLVSTGDSATVSGFGSGLAAAQQTDAGSNTKQGKVTAIAGMVDPRTGLVDAVIRLPAGAALIGETVTATIETGAVHGVIVPRDAALPQEGEDVVWQVKDGHARKVKVDVLASAHGRSIVKGDIDPHLPIVVSGNYQLQPGIAVRVAKSSGS